MNQKVILITGADSGIGLGMTRTLLADGYRAVEGNLGVYALRRIEGEQAHFLTLTF